MSEVVTYKLSPSAKYCQIKFDDENRILISVAQAGIKISKLKWGGLVPSETIFEISTSVLFSEEYKFARERLTEKSLEFDMLDVFRDVLLKVDSLESARKELETIFTK